MIALGSYVHIFARPHRREELTRCFETVAGGSPARTVEFPGIGQPMLVISFPGGGHLSIEFTDDAPDDEQPRLGAWLELRADDPPAVLQAALDAGLMQVRHPGHPGAASIPARAAACGAAGGKPAKQVAGPAPDVKDVLRGWHAAQGQVRRAVGDLVMQPRASPGHSVARARRTPRRHDDGPYLILASAPPAGRACPKEKRKHPPAACAAVRSGLINLSGVPTGFLLICRL